MTALERVGGGMTALERVGGGMTALEGDDRPLSAPRSVTSYSSILFYYADSEIRYFNLLPLKGMDP